MNLLSLLASTMLSQSSVNSVSGKTGLSSKQIQRLVMLALPILIKYMTKNASSGDGALSLLGALSQHKNNNSMERLTAPRSSITFSAKKRMPLHRICPHRPDWAQTRSIRSCLSWHPAL